MQNKPTLLLDVDGVLLKWESNLPFFCLDNGINPVHVLKAYRSDSHLGHCALFGVDNETIGKELIVRYNEGKYGRYLAAYDDAVAHLHTLRKDYNLVALTSFGSSTQAYLNRKFNLEAFFPRCFTSVICLDYSVNKGHYIRDVLIKEQWMNIIGFVDDQVYNCEKVKEANPNIPVVWLNRYNSDAPVQSIEGIMPYLESLKDDQ